MEPYEAMGLIYRTAGGTNDLVIHLPCSRHGYDTGPAVRLFVRLPPQEAIQGF